jgi:hypothetical protein
MNAYTIAAYPTVYNGRQYRSRLEARWAAFFDLLGVKHEYEPFDLGKWSPDFRLKCPFGLTILAEVKPIEEFDRDLANRMSAAVQGRVPQDTIIMMIGVAPFINDERPTIGWRRNSDPVGKDWFDANVMWARVIQCPRIIPILIANCNINSNCHWNYPSEVMEMWAEASNEVQWRPESD